MLLPCPALSLPGGRPFCTPLPSSTQLHCRLYYTPPTDTLLHCTGLDSTALHLQPGSMRGGQWCQSGKHIKIATDSSPAPAPSPLSHSTLAYSTLLLYTVVPLPALPCTWETLSANNRPTYYQHLDSTLLRTVLLYISHRRDQV